MKKCIYLILMIFPLLSFSECIELSGRYKCTSSEGTEVRIFSTEMDDGIYVYEFAEEDGETWTFFADGTERPFELTVQGMKIIGMVTTQCDPGTLTSRFKGTLEGDSGDVKINMYTSKDEGKISNLIEIFYNGFQIQTIDETCVPL